MYFNDKGNNIIYDNNFVINIFQNIVNQIKKLSYINITKLLIIRPHKLNNNNIIYFFIILFIFKYYL